MPCIAELPDRAAALDEPSKAFVAQLFRIERVEGFLDVPEPFRPRVARWCGGDDEASRAWQRVEQQQVVCVHSLWTLQTGNFNVLRACRPVSGPPAVTEGPDEIAGSCEGAGRCDFCELERLTCVEPFGRVRGRHSQTAGNAFKSAALHGLVVWDRHAPHRLTDEEITDGLATADEWLSRARAWGSHRAGQQAHPAGAYPLMFWNCFRSAGASQIHPHMQLQLFSGPVGQGALLQQQCRSYRSWCAEAPSDSGTGDLCLDVAEAHRRLGLAADVGGAVCWASLTPGVGGGELCCLESSQGEPRLARSGPAVVAMVRALRRCGADGISTVAFPVPAGDGEAWLVRCMSRGAASPHVVDVGSSELAGVTGAFVDPYALLAALEAAAP